MPSNILMESEDYNMDDDLDTVRHIDLNSNHGDLELNSNIKMKNRNMVKNNSNKSPMSIFIKFIWSLVCLFALYLSFKCNNGFNLQGFLGALLFGPLYVAYKLGSHWDKCFPKK